MSTSTRIPAAPFRVLVVGADPAPLAALLGTLAPAAAFRLEGVPSAQAALAHAAEGDFDVALIDLDGQAPAALELLRERAPNLPLVGLGHSDRAAAAEAALRRGAQDVLFADRLEPLALARAVRSAGERRRLRESLRRHSVETRRFQEVLLELGKTDLSEEEPALRRLLRTVGRTLGVERVGLWLYSADRSSIVCRLQFLLGGDAFERGAQLRATEYPRYFGALDESRAVPADDAHADPRTSEFSAGYLRPLGISSMLDVPVRLRGRLAGVVCHEHVGPKREWTPEEQEFASSVADLAALALEAAERRHAEEALRDERNFVTAVLDTASMMVAVLDGAGRIVRVNRAFSHALGWPAAEAAGAPFLELVLTPEDAEVVRASFLSPPSGDSPAEHEHSWITRDGTRPRVAWTLSALRGPDGAVRHFVVTGTDITERKALEEQLVHDAFHDSLTGLPNRALFLDRLGQAVRLSARRQDRVFAVLFLDLDRFKTVNDGLGHLVGDRLLVEVARRLERAVRPGDTVARFGGDEFTLLLDDVRDRADAAQVAARVMKSLRAPLVLEGHEVTPTASIGVALSNVGYERPEDVIRDADIAMYRAKARGGACHEVFDRAMHSRAVSLLRLETDLRQAIERGEFVVHYQPVVSLHDGRVASFEALVRWAPPGKPLVPPADFIKLCEDTGLIVPLDRWVLRQAAGQIRDWRERFRRPLGVSVNLSGRQFGQADLADHVRDALLEAKLPEGTLSLEITEGVLLDPAPTTVEVLERLHSAGARLYLDDFGTGYSSLSYLHRFPIDALKIDRSFVWGLKPDGEGREIIRTIMALAQGLDLQVIAEGVETDEQAGALKELRCDYAQGYKYSRPVPAADAEALLAAGR
jgi:diguanylate cyclase (GGDEF)-like protein/PAS domain S-box-containing protein